MKLYGPLPLSLARTSRWPESVKLNGIANDLAASFAAWTGGALVCTFFANARPTGKPLPGRGDVPPRKTKHISLNVCSPSVTAFGGLNGLLGLLELLS